MNLRPRILILTGLLIVASAVAAWWASRQMAEQIIEQWGARYAEQQVLYDKIRTLQPILRETALARQLADSQVIRNWALSPDDPGLSGQAIAELESFRLNFSDHSYFVALGKNGHYYYNDAGNRFAGHQLRYTLNPHSPADEWFYDLIRQGRDLHLNVNPDAHLGVTKLWIDVLIRNGNDILGVAGTGLDLTPFIRDVVDTPQPGITSLFVDRDGAIQVYRDQRMIDFASITKSSGQHNDISLLFADRAERDTIYAAMKELEKQKVPVLSRAVEIKGKRYLAGIAYLPEIGWYEITLLDLDQLLPISRFSGILLVYGLTLLAALVLFNLMLGRVILRPLEQLEGAMDKVQQGRFMPDALPSGGKGEIGRLMQHFADMTKAIWNAKADLEAKVRERTEALEHLSKTDSLTQMLNRRGMTERIETELSHGKRGGNRFGILWLDVDYFKEINDRYGHAIGDKALVEIAGLIQAIIRPYDSAARWGGDEFLILVQDCDEDVLAALGERIRAAIADSTALRAADGSPVALGVSIGCSLSGPDGDLETLLQNADHALYDAKEAGRNCLRFHTGQAQLPFGPRGR